MIFGFYINQLGISGIEVESWDGWFGLKHFWVILSPSSVDVGFSMPRHPWKSALYDGLEPSLNMSKKTSNSKAAALDQNIKN